MFREKLSSLYENGKIDHTQYSRYLSTFNNAQNRLDDLELPGTRMADEPRRLVKKAALVPVPESKKELKRPVKKE
jgi:hypothetical protein